MPHRVLWTLLPSPLVELERKVELTLQQTRNYRVRSLGEPSTASAGRRGVTV